MKIVVDRTRCMGVGICESLAPEVFEVGPDGVAVARLDAADSDQVAARVQEAVDSCPTEALSVSS